MSGALPEEDALARCVGKIAGLGLAVLGSAAAGAHKDVVSAINVAGRMIAPAKGKVAAYHAAKHRVFLQMHKEDVHQRKLMAG